MNRLGVIEDGAVAVHRGRIKAVGTTNEVIASFRGLRRVYCRGRTLLPGFVDCHTHPVFAKMRVDEFAMRCRGADYEEIREHMTVSRALFRPDGVHLRLLNPTRPMSGSRPVEPSLEDAYLSFIRLGRREEPAG